MKKLVLSLLLVIGALHLTLRAQTYPDCPQTGNICVEVNGQTCCINCPDVSETWIDYCDDGTVYYGCGEAPPPGLCGN
jgi:hypothetical protein